MDTVVFRAGQSVALTGVPVESRRERFHEAVQFCQIDVGQDRTDPGALRCSGECAVVFPLLHISRFQKFPHQGDKMFVLDTSAEDFNQNVVVEAIKAGGNVALNHPVDARKVSLNFF